MATINLGRIKPVFRGAYSGGTAYVVDDIVTANGASYICIQAHGAGTQAVSQTAYWTEMSAAGSNPQLSMTWDNATADSDNGAGKIAWNHATIASATVLYVDDADDASANIQPYVDTWDAVTNTTAKGIVTITKEGTPSTFATFKVTGAVVDATGYSKIPVTHLVSNGTFSDGDGVGVNFNYSGLDGTDIGTTITTQGDVLYRDGSGLQRLAAGTAGQFLKTQGAGANPVWAGSGLAMQAVHTASTLTAVAGRAYPIDTTSNACTITLPASATAGDELKFIDYAGKWGTNAITLEPQTLNYQGGSVTQPVYNTDRQSVTIVYVDATQGWIPTVDDDVSYETAVTYNLRYLIVGGGGGGGGDNGGGGGAGGYRTIATKALTVTEDTVYTVTVGTGGLGGTNDPSGGSSPNSGEAEGDNGTASSLSGGIITTITSAGGGGGGSSSSTGVAGGSGGGGGQNAAGAAGNTPSTSPSQGNAGSAGGGGTGTGGAGGGASTAGSSVTGGAGSASDITGASVTYAGGGGGGEDQASSGNAGAGGAGGGGAGSNTGDGTDGTDALGGGGGGGHQDGTAVGGDGGNGVVILRMLTSDVGTPSGHASSVTDGSDTVITWTSTGSYTA